MGTHESDDTAEIPQVPAADLPAKFPQGATLLDVREDDEWAAGHAPQAVHIPLGDLAERAAEVTPLVGQGDSGRQLAVVCRAGGRSQRAAMFLAATGVEVVNVSDGMQGWARAGLPMLSETGADPTVI